MRTKTMAIVVLALAALLPIPSLAVVSCTVSGDNPITVSVQSTNTITGGSKVEEINATIQGGSCTVINLPYSSCEFTATQNEPGPSSVTVQFVDEDGTFLCGPYTNEDGLPVELIAFSVE